MLGMLGPLLNRKSDLSVRYGVLLYNQLFPMMDYATHGFGFWHPKREVPIRQVCTGRSDIVARQIELDFCFLLILLVVPLSDQDSCVG
jgi:hypothetical protein